MKDFSFKFIPEYCFLYEHWINDLNTNPMAEIWKKGINIKQLMEDAVQELVAYGISIEDIKRSPSMPTIWVNGGHLQIKYGNKNIYNQDIDMDDAHIKNDVLVLSTKEILAMIKKSKHYKPKEIEAHKKKYKIESKVEKIKDMEKWIRQTERTLATEKKKLKDIRGEK